MKFKTMSFSAVMAATVAGGFVAAFTAPAQALSIANGSTLNLTGSVNITGNPGNYQFDFLSQGLPVDPGTPGDIELGLVNTLSFAGVTEVPGGAKIRDLATSSPGGGFETTPITNFITGLKLSTGEIVSFNLNAFSEFTTFIPGPFGSQFGVNGGGLVGSFVSDSGSVLGKGALTAQFATSSLTGVTTYSASIRAIPTPALLPGLLGLALGALRKRKAEPEMMKESGVEA